MKKDDCIFCKLANGDIPTNSLYEDDIVKVIFDAGPASDGHVLILPKNHYDDIYSMPWILLIEGRSWSPKIS